MSPQKSSKPVSWANTTFVNIKLDEQQKKTFSGWLKELGDEVATEIAVVMSDNGKMSISWDTTNACFIASLTCKDEKSKNVDHCVTSRSADWYEAVCLTTFKISVILKDIPWSEAATPSNWG